jgi:hypothetical protein
MICNFVIALFYQDVFYRDYYSQMLQNNCDSVFAFNKVFVIAVFLWNFMVR